MAKLSALVVAHNEERQLDACLSALRFADEIVVVLDKCTDGSKAIAAKHTSHIVEGAWPIEGERRNTGIAACNGEWILEIDADERVSAELAGEIRIAIGGGHADYYVIPFDNYIGGKLVKYGWGCHWGVGSAPRLFRKGGKRWGMSSIHPSYDIDGQEGALTHPIAHYVDDNISDMLKRFNRYTTARAHDLIEKKIQESFAKNLKRIFSRFFKCYVLRKGYREGYYGFLNAMFAGLYPIVSFFKAWEMRERTL